MIIPKELEHLLNTQKRKDVRERTKRVYNALLYKRGNNNGYFQCPSAYLEKVSTRYYKAIEVLLEHNIIAYQSFNDDESDLFNTRRKKYYNTSNGTCMRYKFLIDTESGREDNLDIDFTNLYDSEKWYHKTRLSLLHLGFNHEDLNIKRDNFSRRLHTNITNKIGDNGSYKDLLSGGEYWSIDAKTCQPRLLWIYLQEIGLQDKNLNDIFENNIDFYDYIIERIPALEDRDDAKETFTSWINGTGYLNSEKAEIRDIFAVANYFMKNFKKRDYKNMCRLLQYREANIFIDDILNNIPLDFVLTVHDSIIVKKEDKESALQWCQERHKDIKFTAEEIKRK
jgi:hypothetical protein